jgi:predicted HAD superfamily Cof-like phosphohydrolase
MSLSNFEKVIEFMTYSGQEVNTIERPDLMDNNDLINLRIKLIEEEINEYIDANKINDNVEMLDAIVDTLYVVYGTGVSFGINLDKLYNTFILNKVKNSSLILGMTNYEKTKFISTNNSNDISDILLNNLDQIKHSFNLAKSFDLVKSSLLNILFTLYNYNYNYQCKLLNSQELVNLDKAFDLVHISNMTKFCKSEEEAINTVNKYKLDSNSKYKNISYKQINNLYIIYDSDTGKTLKSINYIPVNLTNLVS